MSNHVKPCIGPDHLNLAQSVMVRAEDILRASGYFRDITSSMARVATLTLDQMISGTVDEDELVKAVVSRFLDDDGFAPPPPSLKKLQQNNLVLD